MNKKTIALTAEQYKTIIATMKQGFSGCRPNERIATALILEANLGLRIPISSNCALLILYMMETDIVCPLWNRRQRKPEPLPCPLPFISSSAAIASTTI